MSKLQPKTTKTPTLRFPEFSGEWEEKKLGDLGSVKMCKRIFTHQTKEVGEVPFYKIGTLGREADAFISQNLFEKYKSKFPFPRKGQTLITCSGTIGRSVQFDGHDSYYQDSNIVWIDNDENINDKFLFLLLRNYKWDKLNSTTITRIYTNDLKSLKSSFPSPQEQHKIASFLTTVDDWIENLKKQKESLEEYKKGMLQKLFSQEIRFKDENGQDYPEWEEKRLGEFINLRQEKFNPIIEESNEKDIELESIESRSGLLKEVFDSKDQLSIKNRFYKGDILYGKLRPYLRKYFFATFDGVCSSEFWVIEGKSVEKDYLYLLIQGSRFAQSTEIQSGSKMPRAEWSVVRDFFYNLPTPQEQNKIASFLSSIDDLINLSNQRITLAEEWKKGLMQGMFV